MQPSDSRLKSIIREINPAEQLQNVNKLKIVQYKYRPEYINQLPEEEKHRKSNFSNFIVSLHNYIVQFQTTTGMEGVPHTGVIAQDVQKVLPDAVSSGGQMFLSNGEEIGDMLIVNKDRLFLGNSYQKKN